MDSRRTQRGGHLQVWLLLGLMLSLCPLEAETVRLRGGQVVQGRVVQKTAKIVVISTDQGMFTFALSDVLQITPDGAGQVALPPLPQKDPLAEAAMGFLPFYSALYAGPNDYLGAILGTANGAAALTYLSHAFRRSLSPDEALGWQRRQMDEIYGYTFYRLNGAPGLPPPTEEDLTFLRGARALNGHLRGVRLATGQIMAEPESNAHRSAAFQVYLAASVANAALTYVNLRFQHGRPIARIGSADDSFASLLVLPVPQGWTVALMGRF